MGATDLFGSDAGWVGVCGLSCVVVDCTPPPSTRGTADSSKLTPNPNGLHYGLLDSCPSTYLVSVRSWEWPRYIIPSATPGETSHCNGSPVPSCIPLAVSHVSELRQGFTLCRFAHPKAKETSDIRLMAYNWRESLSPIAALISPTPRLLRRREVGNVDAA